MSLTPISVPKGPVILAGLFVAVSGFTFWAGYTAGRHHEPPQVPVQVAHALTQQAESARVKVDTVLRVRERAAGVAITDYQALRGQLDDALARLAAPVVIPRPDSAAPSPPSQHTDLATIQEGIRRCDALAESCTAFRATALSKFAIDSQVIHAKDHELAAWKASQPSLGSRLRSGLIWLGVGLAADRIALHAGH